MKNLPKSKTKYKRYRKRTVWKFLLNTNKKKDVRYLVKQ